MCGINGFIINKNCSIQFLETEINKMNDSIIHRGPDDDGVYINIENDHSIALGMRRLSIIDLSSGKQPIFAKEKELVIVFNGEIYNYVSLKKELEAKGAIFSTKSDTEVILKLYELEGEKSFHQLDGMYGFCIYDRSKKKIFIARDFFGEKPIYYTQTDNGFIWGSELKSILKRLTSKPTISTKGLNLYLRLTYIPAPYTIYNSIFKLKPAHYISYDIDSKKVTIHPIQYTRPENDPKIPFTKAKESVRQLVYDSVLSRSIADVPLGTFLSGGVDSSIVSLCLSQSSSVPIDTFSIGFEKKSYDETDKSRTVAKLIGSKHHEFIIGEKDLQDDVSQILLNFDEPFADSSSLPTYLVSKKTSEFVKVALTGDGGDEVFGGYNKYYMGKMNNAYTAIVPKNIHEFLHRNSNTFLRDSNDSRGYTFKINRFLNAVDYDGKYYWDIISLGYANTSLEAFLLPNRLDVDVFKDYRENLGISAPKSLSDFKMIDKAISLEGDMLVKVDRTSMLNSLECRAPFLNKKLWEYTQSLPDSFLMKGWNKKYILKESFKDQFPKGFLDKSKSGFGVPVGDWLRSSLKKELLQFIDPKFLEEQQIFNVSAIRPLVLKHLSGEQDATFKVWTLYCFQKWYMHTYQTLAG
jgi:asparagine synthase (glutamine-hydrolysing)